MTTYWYPELLKNQDAFPATILFTFYERGDTKISSKTDMVHLFLPENFTQPTTISWDQNFSGGKAVLNVASEGVSKAIDMLGKISKLGKKIGEYKNALQKRGIAAKDLGGMDLYGLATGTVINPYIAQLFKGVSLRTFTFRFKFIPFNEQDCKKIHDIIQIFRKWSLPSGGNAGAENIYFTYPGEVVVDYLFRRRE